MINEKALCAAMKDAYRNGGYEVMGIGKENTLVINGKMWCAAAPQTRMPRKVLALLVEHLGEIPRGQAAIVRKKEGVQTMVVDMAMERWEKLQKLTKTAAEELRPTPMTWKGREVWQTEALRVLAYDSELSALALAAENVRQVHGDLMVCQEADTLVSVRAADVIDDTMRATLETMMLCGG